VVSQDHQENLVHVVKLVVPDLLEALEVEDSLDSQDLLEALVKLEVPV